MSVTILGVIDITDRVLQIGKTDAEYSPAGYVPARRTFRIADNDFLLAPFGDGVLGGNNWRNATIEVTDDDGDIIFQGVMQDADTEDDGPNGTVTVIQAVSAFGSVATFPVETGNNVFATANGGALAGGTIVLLESGSAALDAVASISFSENNAPRYLVASYSGSPVTQVNLDRPLEVAIADGTLATIDLPRVDTPANLLYRALLTAMTFIGRADLLDADSFASLHAAQSSAGLTLWELVRAEDRVSVGDYVTQICNATGLRLSESADGTVRLVDGPGWDGIDPLVDITEDWIVVAPMSLGTAGETNPLVYAYSHLYASGAGIGVASRALSDSDPNVLAYGPTKVSIPFPANGGNLGAYKILYADADTAEYYGERLLSYYSVDRRRAELTIVTTDKTGATLGLRQFSVATLSATLSGRTFAKEPVRVISIADDEEAGTTRLTLELINEVWPGLTNPA